MLLKKGADIETTTRLSLTPLYFAAHLGHLGVVKVIRTHCLSQKVLGSA